MNKNIIIALALVVVIGGIFWLSEPKQMTTVNTESSLQTSIVSIKDSNNKLYTIDAEYPQFADLPAQAGVSDSFNKSIADFAESNISEFKKASVENWQARQDTMPAGEPKQEFPDQPFYFTLNWESEQLNADYISFIARFAEYVGGANENQNLKAFNYDFANKREVALADLFPGVPDYLQKISDIVRSDLILELDVASGGHAPTDMINQGTEPTEENFANFVFNNQTITFYFPKYQVAPGVFGEQHVPILKSSVK